MTDHKPFVHAFQSSRQEGETHSLIESSGKCPASSSSHRASVISARIVDNVLADALSRIGSCTVEPFPPSISPISLPRSARTQDFESSACYQAGSCSARSHFLYVPPTSSAKRGQDRRARTYRNNFVGRFSTPFMDYASRYQSYTTTANFPVCVTLFQERRTSLGPNLLTAPACQVSAPHGNTPGKFRPPKDPV